MSTYNWPEALDLVLKSVQAQTVMPDEILIADDGSREETRQVIDSYRDKISSPIKHIWHEDEGYRKCRIMNKAVAASEADYIIQIDGDCILHKKFIEDHISRVQANTFLYGSRVNVLQDAVKEVFEKRVTKFGVFSKLIKNRTRNLHIPFLGRKYKPEVKYSRKIRGCNLSFWKKDFIAVNGYNNVFEGWGRDDSDLTIRLTNNGVQSCRIRYMAIVYHIWHKDSLRNEKDLKEKDQKDAEALEQKIIRYESGINEYL